MIDPWPNFHMSSSSAAGSAACTPRERCARAPVRVTLVDRRNHHVFQPLLYQVATAALSPGDIASPIRWILRRQTNAEVLLAEVARDRPRAPAACILADGEICLRLPDRRHRRDARLLRPRRVARDARRASRRSRTRSRSAGACCSRSSAPSARRSATGARALLTFVVIGGGPTGVEMAGALAEISRQSLARDFRHIDPQLGAHHPGGGGPVASWRPSPSRCAKRRARDLERLGVEVRTGSAVTERRRPGASRSATRRIAAETVLWAAGVAASPLGATLGAPLDRAGRVLVEPDLTVPGIADVFVIGDLASLEGADGKPLPGVAQVAIQMGRHAARTSRGRSSSSRYRAVPLQGPGQHGDHRPRLGGRRFRLAAAARAISAGWRGSSSTSST